MGSCSRSARADRGRLVMRFATHLESADASASASISSGLRNPSTAQTTRGGGAARNRPRTTTSRSSPVVGHRRGQRSSDLANPRAAAAFRRRTMPARRPACRHLFAYRIVLEHPEGVRRRAGCYLRVNGDRLRDEVLVPGQRPQRLDDRTGTAEPLGKLGEAAWYWFDKNGRPAPPAASSARRRRAQRGGQRMASTPRCVLHIVDAGLITRDNSGISPDSPGSTLP